ncbi:MBL fold metallo-hydrolase [Deinococcus pimensis]|uniref:MBL fold metallo-hydrolase n=1 Tax=Deinococcus pimensis TaxID=309888 RepID=UPI000489EDF9|nr:MBL fold metallo-hydrolase [Deinococcus pimensis]
MSRLNPLGGLQEVRPDVARVLLVLVNAYMLGERGGPWVMVDAGMPRTANILLRLARERFGGRPPEAIVMTHGHFDHVGALRELADTWDVPILAHPLELPYLTGRSAYPPPDPTVGGGLMALSSPLFPPGPFDFSPRVRALPADGSVPGLPGWRWIHTPGHSPGHVSLWRASDGTLVAGDAFVTTPQESMLGALTQFPQEVRRPPAYYTPDWTAARASVERLAALEPVVAATGHGTPMWNELLRAELRVLARRFDELARPRHGRYAFRAPVVDEGGVRDLPPPLPADPKRPRRVGVALAGLGLLFWLLRRS